MAAGASLGAAGPCTGGDAGAGSGDCCRLQPHATSTASSSAVHAPLPMRCPLAAAHADDGVALVDLDVHPVATIVHRDRLAGMDHAHGIAAGVYAHLLDDLVGGRAPDRPGAGAGHALGLDRHV